MDGNLKIYQYEIRFFYPLTEQIPLELDYTDCDTREKHISVPLGISIGTGATWGTIAPSTQMPELRIHPNDSVGYLGIGGVQIGLKKEPNKLQKLLYKLLGFGWKHGN